MESLLSAFSCCYICFCLLSLKVSPKKALRAGQAGTRLLKTHFSSNEMVRKSQAFVIYELIAGNVVSVRW